MLDSVGGSGYPWRHGYRTQRDAGTAGGRPLIFDMARQLGLPEIIDKHLGRHGNHQGWAMRGWLAATWIAYILSEGDHRKSAVEDWARRRQLLLGDLTGETVREANSTMIGWGACSSSSETLRSGARSSRISGGKRSLPTNWMWSGCAWIARPASATTRQPRAG